MQKIKPFGTGFVTLVSKGGLAVTHPNTAAVGQTAREIRRAVRRGCKARD